MGLMDSDLLGDEMFEEFEIPILSGESLLLFTDGFTDCKITEDTRLGFGGLKDICREFHTPDPQKFVENIFSAGCKLSISEAWDDDVMLLAIHRNKR